MNFCTENQLLLGEQEHNYYKNHKQFGEESQHTSLGGKTSIKKNNLQKSRIYCSIFVFTTGALQI